MAELEKKFEQVKLAAAGAAVPPVNISAPQANTPK
jgi:hypothetical protein